VPVPLDGGPHRCRVVCAFGVAFEATVPPFATVETNCDDVVFTMPVGAAAVVVHTDPVNEFAMDGVGLLLLFGHHNPGTKMAMPIVIGMLNDGFSCGVVF